MRERWLRQNMVNEDAYQAYLAYMDPCVGEVYVLNDGGEVDLDLGNYERYLDVTLTRDNNITTGKIYREVIEREVYAISSSGF